MTEPPHVPSSMPAPRVAVIVPIHNVEAYLSECLTSIAAQTVFDDLDVILVDDGSADRSPQIAAEFAAEHANVTLIVQPNSGPGVARNRALREVRAPLVTFCDSDDVLPPGSVQKMRDILLEHDADVAVGTMRTFPQRTPWLWLRHMDQDSKVVPGLEHAPELIYGAGPCNKLFRTAMLRKLGVSFREGCHFEDVYFTLPVLLSGDRIALTSEVVYLYRQRATGGSIMDSLFSRTQNFWDHLAVEEFLHDLRPSVPGPRRALLDLFLVRSFQGFALRAPEVLDEADLRRFYDRSLAVYRWMAPDVIHQACIDTRHRIALLSFVLDDWQLFADRDAAVQGLEAHDGRLYLQLGYRVPDLVQALLVADRISAQLESIDRLPSGDVLRFRGRFHVGGLTLSSPAPCSLGLRVRGSGITQAAGMEVRHVHSAGVVVDSWSGFVCDIPARKLKSGRHQLRLVFTTATGQASVHVRPTNGALTAARTMAFKSCWALLRKEGNSATLQVQPGEGARARRRWRRDQVLDDLKHVVGQRPMWRERLLRLLTAPFFRSPIWLIGERRDTAQDNSYVFFDYLRRERPDLKVHYLIERGSKHAARVRPLGRVVWHSSVWHRLLMLHARVLLNSYDIDSYMLPRQWSRQQWHQHLSWRVASRRVFLQHGVIYNNVSAALHKGVTGLDLFVTSSQREAEAVRSGMGYGTEVVVTGLPRYDRLNRGPVGRRVLVMPTWRNSLVRPSYSGSGAATTDFEASEFGTFWRSFLHDGRLLDVLTRADVTLEFLAHYEIARFASALAPDHERIIVSHHESRSVQEAILDSSLFLTDWSSAFFDAAYAGRPVVTAPFDEENFRLTQYREGYFDFARDGFGPVARTVDEAVDAVIGYVESGFTREAVYDDRVSEFFAYRDAAQCRRVLDAIERMLSGTAPATALRAPERQVAADVA